MKLRTRLKSAILACVLLIAPSAGAQEWERADKPGTGAGAEVAWSVLHAAIAAPYAVAKGAYALGGTGLGFVSWVFSGADSHTFKSIAKPATHGDYLLNRKQAFGQQDFTFFGPRPELKMKQREEP